MNEAAWGSLLESIRENNVVPIIGSRLLVGADGKTSLHRQIAERFLRGCGKNPAKVALPPYRELQEAVSLVKASKPRLDLYDAVHRAFIAVTTTKDFIFPKPIQQLAEIADFRLFVTLTTDDLLARILGGRCEVKEIVHSPELTESEDLSSDWKTQSDEVNLLYLFGKSRSNSSMFAIHDEDFLEYAHNLVTRGHMTLPMFLGVLQHRNLLLIGCNFPEWLSRFFLRATNRQRLSLEYRRSWLIEQLKPEESFTCFLQRYGGGTEVLSDLSPVDFVKELHARWRREYGVVEDQLKSVADEIVPPPGTVFFISYSRTTDWRHAEVLYKVLLELGVPKKKVWFDRTKLEPGQDFQRHILEGIRECRYFLPLLSRASNQRDEAFVFKEWEEATERLKGMNRDFIFPIVVDTKFQPDRYTQKSVRSWADKHLNFVHAPKGSPGDILMRKLTVC